MHSGEGTGDVGLARYEPALLPPMPDHKGFKLQQLVKFQKFSTARVNTMWHDCAVSILLFMQCCSATVI